MSSPSVGVLLIHGGFHGAWCWDPVLPLLDAPATALDLPFRTHDAATLRTVTFDHWVEHAVRAMTALPYDRLVVGAHSLGGMTMVKAAAVAPERLGALVFVAAMLPGFDPAPSPLGEQPAVEGVWPIPPDDVLDVMLYNDVQDRDQIRELKALLTPEPHAALRGPFSRAGLPQIPLYRVLGRQDTTRMLVGGTGDDDEWARIATEGYDVSTVELGGGHSLMTTYPTEVAAIFNQAIALASRS